MEKLVNTPKVYCSNCAHPEANYYPRFGAIKTGRCGHPSAVFEYDDAWAHRVARVECVIKNKNNDCGDFEQTPPQRSIIDRLFKRKENKA